MASSSDPANVAYVIQENGFWYVAYKEKVKVPNVIVSAKGVANGLSEEYNDGWDFGPDSYNPSVTSGVPLTQTCGIQEAWNYAFATATTTNNGNFMKPIELLSGYFIINKKVFLSPNHEIRNPKMIGQGSMSTYIGWGFDDNGIEIDHTNGNITRANIEIGYMQPYWIGPSTVSNTNFGFFAALYISSDPGYQTNPIQSYDMDFANNFPGMAMFYLTGIQQGIFINIQAYNGGKYGMIYSENTGGPIEIFGCQNSGGGVYITGASSVYITQLPNGNAGFYGGISVLLIEQLNIYNALTLVGDIDYIFINELTLPVNFGSNYTIITSLTDIYNINHLKINHFYATTSGTDSLLASIGTGYVAPTCSNIEFGTFSQAPGITASLASPINWRNVPSTPSVPASGTAQENTLFYPVDVFLNAGVGTVITITRGGVAIVVWSVSTAVAFPNGPYKLLQGDSITLTYTTAPTWEWLSAT
jgi:hypothetical protein